ncbi:MAG: hypothetical protein LBK99_05175 [Opitutaceae bacterium]|nr:hypothetical protein [Opitutaceae bacterium]
MTDENSDIHDLRRETAKWDPSDFFQAIEKTRRRNFVNLAFSAARKETLVAWFDDLRKEKIKLMFHNALEESNALRRDQLQMAKEHEKRISEREEKILRALDP